MSTVTVLFGMLRAALIDRQRLMLENALLRQQVIVLKRSVSRPSTATPSTTKSARWACASC